MNLNEATATLRTVKARLYDLSGAPLPLSHVFSTGELKIVQPDGTVSNATNLPAGTTGAATGTFDIVVAQSELQQRGQIRLQLNASGVSFWEWVEPVDYAPVLSNDSRWGNLDASISSRAATADSRFANLDASISSRAATADSRFANLDATVSSRAATADSRFANLTHLDADVSTRAATADSRFTNLDVAVSSRAQPSDVPTASAIVTALLTAVLGNDGVRNRTVQGVLRRLDWILTSRAAGLISGVAQWFQYDGATVGVSVNQDPTVGTRVAASTVTGD